MEGAGDFRPAVEGGAGLLAVGVGHVALGVVAGAAIAAVAAGDGGGHHDAVADVQVAHVAAQRLDDTHGLMAEDGALAHAADGATHEVQVGAADGRCGDADHRIGAGQHLGLCDVVQAYVADIVEYHCFHDRLPLSGRCRRAWITASQLP